ncbi:MAG: hypothetical protein E7566_03570 [Ruminococcaceae bacterium]|nr:hypothetical protein [Oscillospiraceae bacterium]
MKSEVIIKALTDIDDKLITEAETYKASKKNFRPIYALCAIAACLVLVFSFIFSLPKNNTTAKLLLGGEVISDSPLEVHLPATASAREINNKLSLSLTLQISDDTNIKVSHGKMDICSSDNTDTLYFSGTEYTTDKPVNINWYLDGTDINSVYKLTLGDSIVYTLSYDESISLWSICKQ